MDAHKQPDSPGRLESATVPGPDLLVLLGLGGLGCPAILASISSGIPRMLLVDGDTVSTSNLQRQVIYRGASEGHSKAHSARRFIQARAPATRSSTTCF